MRMTGVSGRRAVFTEGLIADQFRGWDSTGLAAIKAGKEKEECPFVFKRALAAQDFVQLRPYLGLLRNMEDYSIVMGHNRAATAARVSDQNAHPFQVGPVTLVHNGTLHGTHDLDVKTETQVDSESAAAAIAKYGPEKALPMFKGGYALVWHDARDGSLNFARNDAKPLVWAFEKNSNTIFWASEAYMLWWLMVRNQVKMDGKFRIVSPHTHYRFIPDHAYDTERKAYGFRAYERFPFVPLLSQNSQPNRPGTGAAQTHGKNTTTGESDAWRTAQEQAAKDRVVEEASTKARAEVLRLPAPSKTTASSTTTISPLGAEEVGEITTEAPKSRANSGRPGSNRKIKRVTVALERMGFKYEERVIFTPKEFIKYKNQTRGAVAGWILKNGDRPAIIHDQMFEDYERMLSIGSLYVNVVNFKPSARKGEVRLTCEVPRGGLQVPSDASTVQARWRAKPDDQEVGGDSADSGDDDVTTELQETVTGPHGKPISIAKFFELVADGCANCGGHVSPRYADRMTWEGDILSPICHECTTDRIREDQEMVSRKRNMH